MDTIDYLFSIFKVPGGVMGAVKSPYGLHMILLPKPKAAEIKKNLKEHYSVPLTRDEQAFDSLKKRMGRYFKGQNVLFREKLDLRGATNFELKVWEAVFSIPWGEVRSYSWVANKVGGRKKVRAVGQALKHNRLPLIIPCHRVVEKSGSLGGFSSGTNTKRMLLNLEGRLW